MIGGPVLAAALVASAGPAASAATSAPASTDRASAQASLLDFNTALQQRHLQPGYVASIDDPASGSVTVFIAGGHTVSSQVRQLATASHVTLKAKAWPYSMSQLTAAAHSVLTGGIAAGTGVSATVFDGSFAGITLIGAPSSSTTSVTAARATPMIVAGVPVRVQAGDSGPTATRDRDYAPYNAGDFMFAFDSSGHSHYCSTGFAVRYQGHNYTTTAQHCSQKGFRTLDDESDTFGTTKKDSKGAQARMLTAAGSTIMWSGSWDDGTAHTVAGARTVSIGDSVCTSGANSGSHCGITVKAVGDYNDGISDGPTLEAYTTKGIAVIQGDSGGPVYVPVPHSTKVYAVGMIQEYLGTKLNPNCGDVYDAGTNLCTRGVGFTPIATTLRGLQATLVTK